MGKAVGLIEGSDIQNRIFTIRGMQVMLDRDLAELYQVETKVLNQAVKRNAERFPERFKYQLTEIEKDELVTNCDRLNSLKHSTNLPNVFTEQGVSMLSAVLRSEVAVTVSVQVMDAFVGMRRVIANHSGILHRLDSLEQRQNHTGTQLDKVLEAIEAKDISPTQGIFFDGQVFDAYVFVSGLMKSAKKSIVLIDNYVDETTLLILSKRREGCSASIYTPVLNQKLKLDLQKHNAQYPCIEINTFKQAHDRFLILDDKEIYHIGASLKDLGKKWFAFSKFDSGALEVLSRLKGS